MNKIICLFFLKNQIKKQDTKYLEIEINKKQFNKCLNQLKRFNVKNIRGEIIYFSKYSILATIT